MAPIVATLQNNGYLSDERKYIIGHTIPIVTINIAKYIICLLIFYGEDFRYD